jgi:hypothetical protein
MSAYMCSFGARLLGDSVTWVGDPNSPHSKACR